MRSPKEPTADQLAEARTAAVVVRKLVEKFQPEATRSQAFGQYVDGVKKTLAEVEGNLQRRSLSSAKAAAVQAMKPIGTKGPTDDQFKEANAALDALDKTLEPMQNTDPGMTQLIADAKALLASSRPTVAKRQRSNAQAVPAFAAAQAPDESQFARF